jgi:hypothetical protein
MDTTTMNKIASGIEQRILKEGYGQGAWHGPDLKAALADVTQDVAFGRPAPGRHNIAEIALHHAYCVRSVRARLTGVEPEPFVLDGDDWFTLPDASRLSWSSISELVQSGQERLAQCIDDLESGRSTSPLSETERFGLVLGITCHAVYHAGQIQLVKRLLDS